MAWKSGAFACLAAVCLNAGASDRAAAIELSNLKRSPTDFSYYALGHLVPSKGGAGPNTAPRWVVHPGIVLPMKVDPKKGQNIYCNSQIFGYGGNGWGSGKNKIPGLPGSGSNDKRNFQFPYTTNICEIRDRKTSPSVCPTKTIHQGQDCRPPTPDDKKYEGVAVEAGSFTFQGGKSNVMVLKGKSTIIWNYLHMSDFAGKGDKSAGQKLGLVSDFLQRPHGTSIHLHLEAKFPRPKPKGKGAYYQHVDPLPSLIVAYQKALGNPYTIDDKGNLAFDPRFEIKEGATEVSDVSPSVPFCTSDNEPTIETEKLYSFASLWCHNGSVVGLVKNGAQRQFVYYKPRPGLKLLAKDNPVLFSGKSDNNSYIGRALQYSARCGNQEFEVTGPVAVNFQHVTVSGRRKVFSRPNNPDGTPNCGFDYAEERLEFAYIRDFQVQPSVPTPGGEETQPTPVSTSEACRSVTLADKPATVAGIRFDNYWYHNCSVVGLAKSANGDRRMYYVRPRSDLAQAVAREAAVFRGRSADGRYEGETIQFNKTCGDLYYPVIGPIDENAQGVRLEGHRPRFTVTNGTCKPAAAEAVCLRFTYAGETLDEALARPLEGESCTARGKAPLPTGEDDGTLNLSKNCAPKSVCSNNFPALTPKAEPKDYVKSGFEYIVKWPGYSVNEEFRDKNGYVIPGFKSRVAGTGIWWYWLRIRAGYPPKGKPTFRKLATLYAGINDDRHPDVVTYAKAYRKHSILYFGRQVDIDEGIDMADPDQRWQLAQTMFHHEAGRRVNEVSRQTFEAGLKLAEKQMATE